jgi:hypothetical protein
MTSVVEKSNELLKIQIIRTPVSPRRNKCLVFPPSNTV